MSTINLKNVQLRWAWLAKPNTTGNYPSNKYQVDIVFDDSNKKTIENLINKKQKLKDLGDGLFSITLKSSIKPRVIDKSKKILTDDELLTIGNGTTAIVQVKQYKGFKDELYLGLNAIKVLDVQSFSSLADFGDEDENSPFDVDDEPL